MLSVVVRLLGRVASGRLPPTVELERIRQKVWAGEPLSDTEFSALKHAVGTESGPSLSTTLGQALLNAERPREALPILEAARRAWPLDVQTHLAIARALVSLERWGDAETSLTRVLQLNPQDPEALKVLALCCMRRGEWVRARRCIDEAMAADALDAEAQTLFEELKRTGPAELLAAPTANEYLAALVEALKSRSTPYLVQKQYLLVRLGARKGVARLDVESLHADFIASGRPLGEVVEAVARELAERAIGVPSSRLQLLAKVLPVLRDASFFDRAVGNAHREGPGGLLVFYALDDPELLRYVPQGLLDTARLTVDQLDEAAWANLGHKLADIRAIALEGASLHLSPSPTGLWCVAHGDGHDAARLLLPAQQEALTHAAGPGPWRVYLGLRELVLVCRADDIASARRLEGLEAARDGISGAWLLQNGLLHQLANDE
jgi:tetratricopeptide (TPR) repeat protein